MPPCVYLFAYVAFDLLYLLPHMHLISYIYSKCILPKYLPAKK